MSEKLNESKSNSVDSLQDKVNEKERALEDPEGFCQITSDEKVDSKTISSEDQLGRDIDLYFKDLYSENEKLPHSSDTEIPGSEEGKALNVKDDDDSKPMPDKWEDTQEDLPCDSCEFPDPLELTKVGCWGLCTKRQKIQDVCEFWLISVPGNKENKEKLISEIKKDSSAINYTFHIPELLVGTLDNLVSLIEQLSTLDNYVKDKTERLCEYMKKDLSSRGKGFEENITVHGVNPPTFLSRFSWNKAKYPTWHPISMTVDIIFSEIEKIEKTYKKQVDLLDGLKNSLKKYERRETDTLLYRYLGDIVKKEHFVLNSKYLVTLIVVVPKSKIRQWLKSYENLCDMVVPQSSSKIFQDDSHALFNVTLCKKGVETFKNNARENNFIVRDFRYSEEAQMTEQAYYEKLTRIKIRQQTQIFRWVKINFGECFDAWTHVKALRVFTESVIRYGLPVNFDAMLILPMKSKTKLKKLLDKLYSDVDAHLGAGQMDEVPGGLSMYGAEDYNPYVFFKINIKFICM